MAPGKHNDSSSSNDVSSSTTIPTTESTTIRATDFTTTTASAITTTSMESPTPTALFNTPVVTTSAPAGLVNAAPSSAPTNSGQSSTSVKIIGGIVAALIGILLIFAVAIFYLKRRWKAKEQEESARRAVHAARAARDEEEGGEGTAFIGDKKEHVREDSMASTRSKSSTDDYLKSGRKRSSLGTFYSPGIAAEEAYMMFGGNAANLNEDEEKRPLTYHERHLSESMAASKRSSWGSIPETNDPRGRRISLLDDGSRYPGANASTDSLGRRGMRHSVSYPPGIADPFSDASPATSPKGPSRAFTTGDVTAPGANPTEAKPAGPSTGAQAPGSGTGQGRRVSLQGGVGVRRGTAPGSPGGSPVGSPRAAWK